MIIYKIRSDNRYIGETKLPHSNTTTIFFPDLSFRTLSSPCEIVSNPVPTTQASEGRVYSPRSSASVRYFDIFPSASQSIMSVPNTNLLRTPLLKTLSLFVEDSQRYFATNGTIESLPVGGDAGISIVTWATF